MSVCTRSVTIFSKQSLFLSARMSTTKAAANSVNGHDDNIDDDSNWWKNAVIYQIYPRSFMDSTGDGVGDLKGIISKLPYLVETGIKVVWVNPFYQSPMVDFGYDVSDFRAIQPEYGTMEDFDNFMAAATSSGIKVMLDFVPNHTSDKCEWFKKSAARVPGFENFYVWSDGKVNAHGKREPPNNWQSVFYGSAWTWHEQRQQYYLHQFAKEQPDLNYRNAKVVEAMDDVMLFWLDKGVCGFRIDAVNHLFEVSTLTDEPLSGKTTDTNSYDYTKHFHTKDLPEVYMMVQHWRRLLDNYTTQHGGPARIMMTEAYTDLKTLMQYYENDDTGVQGAHFPFNFHFITDLSATSNACDYVHNVQKWLTFMPSRANGHVANWVMGNHDNPRMASRFGRERVDAMHMLLLTLPGVAATYNGEEIGMEDNKNITWEQTVDPPARNIGVKKYKEVSRDPARTPFQWNDSKNAGFSEAERTWLPVNSNYKELNLAEQLKAPRSHYKVYKELLQLRKLPQLREGRFQIAVLNRDVFAFKRSLDGHPSIITIINVGDKEQHSLNITQFIGRSEQLSILVAGSTSRYQKGDAVTWNISAQSLPTLASYQAFVLREQIVTSPLSPSAERRILVRSFLKYANIVLVGLLMYKLWHNKWMKLNFNKEPLF